jgi:hypothetical protein
MVATILAVNRIGVEGGAKSEIGEARFLMRGLAISPPRFSRFCKRAFPPDFFEKKKTGGNSWAGAPSFTPSRTLSTFSLKEVAPSLSYITKDVGIHMVYFYESGCD